MRRDLRDRRRLGSQDLEMATRVDRLALLGHHLDIVSALAHLLRQDDPEPPPAELRAVHGKVIELTGARQPDRNLLSRVERRRELHADRPTRPGCPGLELDLVVGGDVGRPAREESQQRDRECGQELEWSHRGPPPLLADSVHCARSMPSGRCCQIGPDPSNFDPVRRLPGGGKIRPRIGNFFWPSTCSTPRRPCQSGA